MFIRREPVAQQSGPLLATQMQQSAPTPQACETQTPPPQQPVQTNSGSVPSTVTPATAATVTATTPPVTAPLGVPAVAPAPAPMVQIVKEPVVVTPPVSVPIPAAVSAPPAAAIIAAKPEETKATTSSIAPAILEELGQCKDTSLLVSQLAQALKGLEADLEHLRQENRSLKQTVAMQSNSAPPTETVPAVAPASAAPVVTPVPAGELLRSTSKEDAARLEALASQAPAIPVAPAAPVSNDYLEAASSLKVASGQVGSTPVMARGLEDTSTPVRSVPSRQRAGLNGALGTPVTSPAATPAPAAVSPDNTMLNAGPSTNLVQQPSVSDVSEILMRPTLSSASQQGSAILLGDNKAPLGQRPAVVSVPSRSGTKEGGLSSASCSTSCCGSCSVPQVPQPSSSSWMIEQAVWLGRDPPDPRIPVKVLDKNSIVSVAAAVDGLNRGSLKCPEDVCVVFSAANRGYYALYRRGQKEKAMALSPSKRTESTLDSPEVGRQSPLTSTITLPSAGTLEPFDSASTLLPQQLGGSTPSPPSPPQPQSQSIDARQPPIVSGDEPELGMASESLARVVNSELGRDVSSNLPEATASAPPTSFMRSTAGSASGSLRNSATGKDISTSADVSAACASVGASQAEKLLQQATQSGARPVEAGAEAVITAFAEEGNLAKAEEWLWRTLDGSNSRSPSEATFAAVVLCACKAQQCQKAEEVMLLMMRMRLRPSKELFDAIIQAYSDKRDVWKVEEWLLHAGQSGWTPAQPAFEAVVTLYAERDVAKAEEWLSRAQQTEYTLPDQCFDAVIHALATAGDAAKVSDWLVRMVSDGRSPSDETLKEAVTLLIEVGDVRHAEAWLAQLVGRRVPVQELSHSLYSAAMRAGDLDCAERQLVALNDADQERTEYVVVAHAQLGEAARAKAVFEHFISLGGVPTPEMQSAVLSACAFAGDVPGTESVARSLASSSGLSQSQVSLLRQTLGDERADGFLGEINGTAPAAGAASSLKSTAATMTSTLSAAASKVSAACTPGTSSQPASTAPTAKDRPRDRRNAAAASAASGTTEEKREGMGRTISGPGALQRTTSSRQAATSRTGEGRTSTGAAAKPAASKAASKALPRRIPSSSSASTNPRTRAARATSPSGS